jgi:hypothetical protein
MFDAGTIRLVPTSADPRLDDAGERRRKRRLRLCMPSGAIELVNVNLVSKGGVRVAKKPSHVSLIRSTGNDRTRESMSEAVKGRLVVFGLPPDASLPQSCVEGPRNVPLVVRGAARCKEHELVATRDPLPAVTPEQAPAGASPPQQEAVVARKQ